MGINPFYRSLRVGKGGKTFALLKFRTMSVDGGSPTASVNDKRLTRVGRFLRRYKLDEIPVIFNILNGSMGLVGPRPTVESVIYHDSVSPIERDIILAAKPGITDLGTLWNSNEDETLAGRENPHEVYMKEIYPTVRKLQIHGIKNRSALMDLRIVLRTAMKILRLPFFRIKFYAEGELFNL